SAVRLFGRRPPGQFHLSALRAPGLIEGLEAALESGREVSVTFGLARTGSSDLHASAQPLDAGPDDDAPALAVLIEDHSQPRRAAELHRDFVANASHELKTPLASISGIIETLTGHARDDPEATERFLGMMAAQVERMKRLVQDLLSLNRIELNERMPPEEPQSVRRIAWEAAEALEPLAAAEGVTLDCDPPAESPRVAGDGRELMQLFSNLIDNAIKYGGDGGIVTVRTVRTREGAGRIGIEIGDRGPGIAREHVPRLTERFYRVSPSHSRARGGTGLGLAIAKHIVNRHRGELRIESTPGEGATFTVWLPVLEEAAEDAPPLAASRSA
ncbi:MAG TPA: ATP-binding protein, partial [Thermohalobaculum sp.]|nr:ATP-binding protein [Thermohalobaculum sp.]